MRIWSILVVSTPYLIMFTVALLGNIIGTNAYHEYPSAKRLQKENKRCDELLASQTEVKCEKRLQHCCKSGRKFVKKPLCATTRYGIGMVFYNPCSLHYIRCLYPEICFLKRDLSHQHCRPYQVMTQEEPPDIPCHSFITTTQSTTTLPSTTIPYEGDEITHPATLTETSKPGTEKSPLLQTLMKTLPPEPDTSPKNELLSTTRHFLPPFRTSKIPSNLISSSTVSPVMNSTTSEKEISDDIEPLTIVADASTDITLTQSTSVITTFAPTTVTSECVEAANNVTFVVRVLDAMFVMYESNGRTIKHALDKVPSRDNYQLINNCSSPPPPSFPLCSFPTIRGIS
ncbi:uncharacterized protein [Amphiura filiformis]|uniref:uncharacterized protein n=1 Tax=Amphiura filiformis TaxID=82378 RepID=UPI003B217FCC